MSSGKSVKEEHASFSLFAIFFLGKEIMFLSLSAMAPYCLVGETITLPYFILHSPHALIQYHILFYQFILVNEYHYIN